MSPGSAEMPLESVAGKMELAPGLPVRCGPLILLYGLRGGLTLLILFKADGLGQDHRISFIFREDCYF